MLLFGSEKNITSKKLTGKARKIDTKISTSKFELKSQKMPQIKTYLGHLYYLKWCF